MNRYSLWVNFFVGLLPFFIQSTDGFCMESHFFGQKAFTSFQKNTPRSAPTHGSIQCSSNARDSLRTSFLSKHEESDDFLCPALSPVKSAETQLTAAGLRLPWDLGDVDPRRSLKKIDFFDPEEYPDDPKAVFGIKGSQENSVTPQGTVAALSSKGHDYPDRIHFPEGEILTSPMPLDRVAATEYCKQQGGRLLTKSELGFACLSMGGRDLKDSHPLGFDLNPQPHSASYSVWIEGERLADSDLREEYYWALQFWRTSDQTDPKVRFDFSFRPFLRETQLYAFCVVN